MRSAPSVRVPLVLAALALGAGVVLTGCRSGSALHNRYNNFRAYYNTYYNAERKLEEGETSLERSGSTVDRDRLIPLFPTTATSGRTGGPFQEAIDKSAQLLRERPDSKWADDALLVIGKAYFYQRNFVGAEQKFNETMTAADIVEDRRLRDEARFWLGRTYAASDRYDEGVSVLEEGLTSEDGDRRWTSRMRLALGELYARAGRWDEAAETLRAGAANEADPDLAARAYVLLGQVEEEAGRFEEAAAAYDLALDQKPAYELAFAAEVNRALVIGLDADRPGDGLSIVGGMLRDDKHYERRGELALIQARLLAAAGRDAEAEDRFREVLYEPDLNGQAVRGRAHYYLGQFYDDVRGDLVRASAHFDTAATAYRAPAPTDRPSRSALLGLDEEVTSFNTLATAARQIAEADSLLALGALSEEAFRERITAIEARRRREYVEEQRRMEAQRTAQAFSGGGSQGAPSRERAPSSQASLEAGPGARVGAAEAGFLAYRDPSSIQAGYISFEQRWGDRPLLPNWRRLAAVQGGTATASGVGGVGEFGQNNPFAIGQGPPPLDLSMVPRTPAKREELVTEMASLRYELANAFFLSLGRADTAAALYRAILEETPSLPVATRARYALAEIELSAGREAVARPLYEAVIDADPTSDLARASRIRLQIDEVEGPTVDPAAETSAAYDTIRRRWQAGSPRQAAAAFIALADRDPDAPSAPRAYLAAAVAYIESVEADTLTLRAPLPPDLVSPVLVEAYEPLLEAAPAPAATPPPPDRLQQGGNERAAPRRREGVDEGRPAEGRLDESRPEAPPSRDGLELIDEPRPLDRRPEEVLPDVRPDEVAPDRAPRPESTGDDPQSLPTPATPVPGDSLVAASAVADSLLAPPAVETTLSDSTDAGGRVPNTPLRAGSAVPDSTRLDSTAAAGPEFTLRQHLAAIVARYPGTPYATRAERMVASLPVLPVPAPDSTGDAPVDTPPDSLGAPADLPAVPDTSALAGEAEPGPEALAGLRGAEPIDPSTGGYSWRVQTLSIPTEGESTQRILQGAGFRTMIAEIPEGGGYALLVGQFETEAEASSVQSKLPAWAQLRGEVITLEGVRDAIAGPPKDF